MKDTPPGECRQCWQHAHDPSIHRMLGPREDCPQCVDHMINGHGSMIVPNKESIWWWRHFGPSIAHGDS
ncbi:pRL2-8 [Streptomyces sp. NPDC007808]|uniref:pRL2-8 n=1 Tax=Streptomyces sp. NPDC007808 TaxID=3364779 RepID=UPI00368AA3AA